MKVEYANIASEQLREDDASLGIRVLRIRMLVENEIHFGRMDQSDWQTVVEVVSDLAQDLVHNGFERRGEVGRAHAPAQENYGIGFSRIWAVVEERQLMSLYAWGRSMRMMHREDGRVRRVEHIRWNWEIFGYGIYIETTSFNLDNTVGMILQSEALKCL